MLDANLIATVNSEFLIPISIHYSNQKPNPIRLIIVSLCCKEVKNSKKHFLGKWKFDVANIPNPENTELNCSSMKTLSGIVCNLYFRIVVLLAKNFPHGPPRPYFSHILSTGELEIPEVQTVQEINEIEVPEELLVNSFTPTEFNSSQLTNRLSDFLIQPSNFSSQPKDDQNQELDIIINSTMKKKEQSKNMKSFLTSNEKEISEPEDDSLIKAYHELIIQHETLLTNINLEQARIKLSYAVFTYLIHPSVRLQEHSNELFKPFHDFCIFTNPNITQEGFDSFTTPLVQGIQYLLIQPLNTAERFALITTIINLGIKISNEAANNTSIYLSLLSHLEKSITELMIPLTHTIVAYVLPSIQVDGFCFTDSTSIEKAKKQISLFKSYAINYSLPAGMIQKIISDCCSYLDIAIFNMIVENTNIITLEKTQNLMKNLKTIQKLFTCVTIDFNKVFENCLGFISMSQHLMTEISITRIPPKSKLLRSIADRIRPTIHLPGLLTNDSFGPIVKDRSELKIGNPEAHLEFSFDWLITEGFCTSWNTEINETHIPEKKN